MGLNITPLHKRHDRGAFDCGVPALDHYLRRYAGQDLKRRVSRAFVATFTDDPHRVIGYYTLSAGGLGGTELPEERRRRLPGYPIPVAMLGRLAVARDPQGDGIGAILLANALSRVAQAARVMAVYAVVVEAIDERAAAFYDRFGFLPLRSHPLKRFLPLDSFAESAV
ncbi:GNAT family N-acetyltransferase [Endothiovibrio diazotrophicus]